MWFTSTFLSVLSIYEYLSSSFAALHVKVSGWFSTDWWVCWVHVSVHTAVVDACETRQPTFPIIGCSEQRAARGDLVTFHCHGNSLQVTLGKLHTATPIYSPGLTPDEPWRMSGQDRGGHTRTNTRTQQQQCLHGYYGQQHDSWSIWTHTKPCSYFPHIYSCVYNVSLTGQT